MWSHRAYLNALPMNVMLNATAKNEGGADTQADARAMKAGHSYRTN